jgi:hypothetical protein
MALTQSPEHELVARSVNAVDFLVILAGDLIGKVIASVDTLGAWNVLIGVPVGVVSAQYVKHLRFKEFLMGLGIGIIDGGVQRFTLAGADWVNQQARNAGFVTLDEGIKTWIESVSGVIPAPTAGATPFGVSAW